MIFLSFQSNAVAKDVPIVVEKPFPKETYSPTTLPDTNKTQFAFRHREKFIKNTNEK